MYRLLAIAASALVATAQIPGVVMSGYDVVAYHDINATDNGVLGDEIYWTKYQGFEFWFANETNLNRFKQDPATYVPQWGGFCAYGVAFEFPDPVPNPHSGYPWVVNSTLQCLGPPCDPVSGWALIDGKLYCSINRAIMNYFIDIIPTNNSIVKGNTRWTNWFGSNTAPPFNTDCLYPKAQYSQCMYRLKQMGCCSLGNCDN